MPASFNLEAPQPAYARRAAQLRDTLADDDYVSARASVNNSHYTPVFVIEVMWQAVRGFGFAGGRVLEPSAGIGHFIGAMPAALVERCRLTAVEIDRLSGRILKAQYGAGGVDVRIGAFEKTPLPEGWYDLAIGNVPFGAYKVADASNRPYGRYSVHNYFLGRTLDLLRPGGLALFHHQQPHDGGLGRDGAAPPGVAGGAARRDPAAARRLRRDQLEPSRAGQPALEQGRAVAGDPGVDEELVLVDQIQATSSVARIPLPRSPQAGVASFSFCTPVRRSPAMG